MPENFDELLYLEANPDVQQMLARGEHPSALEHWNSTGAEEHAMGRRRSGFHDYDLVYDEGLYLAFNDDVASAVRAGLFRDGYEHWIRFGRAECADGRRLACFGATVDLFRPFQIRVETSGVLIAGLTTQTLGTVDRLELSVDDLKRVTLDPRSVACSRELEISDRASSPHSRVCLVFWVPDGIIPQEHGSRPLTFTITGTGGEVRVVRFSGATEGPGLSSVDAACELLRTANALAEVSGQGAAVTRAMGSFAQTRFVPPAPRRETEPYTNIHVEHLLAIEGLGFFTVGWLVPANQLLERCRAFCLETGECVDFRGALARAPRPDVRDAFRNELGTGHEDQFGFASLLALPEASRLPDCSLVFAITSRGGQEHVSGPMKAKSTSTFIDAAKVLLASLNPAAADFQVLMAQIIAPAMEALWARERSRRSRSVIARQFGERPTSPTVSVVVPIYGRFDFIKYQLALFANDAEFTSGRVELVYFIDDPRLIESVVHQCQGWAPMYRVPFVVAYTGDNHGFSGANNLGVSVSRGETIILLNSDVMPKRSGWVERMVAAYDGLPGRGVLGAKLLYYDESLQHDGMRFETFPFWNDLYGNNHPCKGLPNRMEADVPPREVEAVTGACMAISRALYLDIGGLCEEFVIGDFEDSELCMRLRHAGKRVFYMPSEELYHLERQSQSLLPDGESWRWQLTVYNSWVQDRKWRAAIDQLKASPLFARPRESVG